MRWAYLAVAVCGFISLWGVASEYVVFAAFLVMFANFASFCLLYDRAKHRAHSRTADQVSRLNRYSEAAQRMSTAKIITTAADRRLGYGPMTILNLVTGIVGAGLLVWGIMLRIM